MSELFFNIFENSFTKEIFVSLLIALILTSILSNFYPAYLSKERVNRELQWAFRIFTFVLITGLAAVFSHFLRAETYLPWILFPLEVYVLITLRGRYRDFLLKEDATWWEDKKLEQNLSETTPRWPREPM